MPDAQAVGDDQVRKFGEGRVAPDPDRRERSIQLRPPARSFAGRIAAFEAQESLKGGDDALQRLGQGIGGSSIAAGIHAPECKTGPLARRTASLQQSRVGRAKRRRGPRDD